MLRAIRRTKLRAPASVFGPASVSSGLEAAKSALESVGGVGHLGVPLAAHQIVSAFHEVPQQFAYLRLQAHPALYHRLPECRQDGDGLRWSSPSAWGPVVAFHAQGLTQAVPPA